MPYHDPRTRSSALEPDKLDLDTLNTHELNALARHPNTPTHTLEHLARHHPDTGPAIASNPTLPLHTMHGPLPDVILTTLGTHPPTHDLDTLRQHLTLHGNNDMYCLALTLHLIENEAALPRDPRAAIEAHLNSGTTTN